MTDITTPLHGVEELIDREQYFVIHAACQSGKTTHLQYLTKRLNAKGKYYALYCSLEGVQSIVDPKEGIPAIVRSIKAFMKYTALPHTVNFALDVDYADYSNILRTSLTDYCRLLNKPLVIFFDGVDCLSESTLILFLRQLRSGYNTRNAVPFVYSTALVGMRNIRDYEAKVRPDSESLGGVSPFNIATEALTLKDFTKEEITYLYRQHTAKTGQLFEDAAIELVWEQTQGQPWLVNAIAYEIIMKILQSDYTKPVTAELVREAIQNIILTRPAHINSLLERLKEERVYKVIEPMILGNDYVNRNSDDFLYTRDLGLIREVNSRIAPANPIYAEVIIRRLSSDVQGALQDPKYPYRQQRYLNDGQIAMDRLMRDFQQFWCENSEIWENHYDNKEAAPHLALIAFLQRVTNGGGQIVCEMASGSGRLDLCLIYANRKYPIELKIRRGETYREEGLVHTARHIYLHGCSEGWLVILDRRPDIQWEEKLYTKKATVNGKTVTVVGV
jgi:hypothetical protein